MTTKKRKPYWKMNSQELADATKEYDSPSSQPQFLKAPRAQKARHDKAMKAALRGRPRIGEGARRIQLTIGTGIVESSRRLRSEVGDYSCAARGARRGDCPGQVWLKRVRSIDGEIGFDILRRRRRWF